MNINLFILLSICILTIVIITLYIIYNKKKYKINTVSGFLYNYPRIRKKTLKKIGETYKSTNEIPKILHKIIFLDDYKKYDKYIDKAIESWVDLNPSYKLKIWTLYDAKLHLVKNYPPIFIETFENLVPYSYKCDFFRYIIIYEYGGWYSDIKEVCLVYDLLNTLVSKFKGKDIIYFQDNCCNKLSNYNNCAMTAFFGSVQHNKSLFEIINTIILNTQKKYYGKNRLYPTGPYLFGKILSKNKKPSGIYSLNYYYINNEKIVKHKINENKLQKTKDYYDLWDKKLVYKNPSYRHKDSHENIAILFTLYNSPDRAHIHLDILKYYIEELKIPKKHIFIVDSYGTGVPEKYVYKYNQFLFNQNKYKSKDIFKYYRTIPSYYEIDALQYAVDSYDFSNFKYVFKITCKYKIPQLYSIINTNFNTDLVIQKNKYTPVDSVPTEIIGIKGNIFKYIVYISLTFKFEHLEKYIYELINNFNLSTSSLKYVSNIAKYSRNDGSILKILSET